MGSKEQQKALLNQQLEQLGSITNSPSINHYASPPPRGSDKVNKTSIISHASKYIEELKERIDKLNEDVSTSQPSHHDHEDALPEVTVETLEKGFIINVFSEKNYPGLLVSILEVFEELGLELLDARVSCSDCFRLEAVSDKEGEIECVDAQMVKQAVLEAIRNWKQRNQQV
ncbi:hypothetical protein H5410_045489 [Solanum commersonii]|uniref:Plant bHLH transcription factor ACT-like domain-containing protein n=1 Tax=Solanum commersonii TaxID=4109 RepID=A0A9J5XBR9_SOLCO|nr:hypothetical protein H5410_045489 [Solanum commersonii]